MCERATREEYKSHFYSTFWAVGGLLISAICMMYNRTATSQIYSLSLESKLSRQPCINISETETHLFGSNTSLEQFDEWQWAAGSLLPHCSLRSMEGHRGVVESGLETVPSGIAVTFALTSNDQMFLCSWCPDKEILFSILYYRKQQSSSSHAIVFLPLLPP